jgi:hypothetical protein
MSLTLAAADILKFETAVLVLVVAGLLVLAKIVSDLRAEVRSLRSAAGSGIKPAQTPAVAPPAPPQPDEIPADVFAAIVSAVHFALGESHQVVSVSPAESLMWSREGRRSIFRSHTFR